MGGAFSGSWTRDTCKNTVESRCSISIQYLKKQVVLREGNNGTLSWSRNDEPCGSISYLVKANGIQFNYHSRSSEQDEGEDVELFIQFDYTACHYGNQRTWLLCPHCLMCQVGLDQNIGGWHGGVGNGFWSSIKTIIFINY